MLLDASGHQDTVRDRLASLLEGGGRVVLLARSSVPLNGNALPGGLVPLAFVLLAEQLRPDAAETVRYLKEQGVGVKILSGDSPSTVAAIATAAGVSGAEHAVDARTISDTESLSAAMERETVFGRVMPEQKSDMVAALQAAGHSVSMTGDGVNDVLAVKQADLGIAMGSGVPAVKAVAQIVLLDDRFASFPAITAEGRRVVANAERVANLFLTKSVWAALLAVAVVVLAVPYPFLPRETTLAGSVTIGIPAFFFALGPSTRPYRRGFVPRVLRFAIPAGSVITVAVLGGFLVARSLSTLDDARTFSTLLLVLLGLGIITVLEWPLRGRRLAVVAGMSAGTALVFLELSLARDFFALTASPAVGCAWRRPRDRGPRIGDRRAAHAVGPPRSSSRRLASRLTLRSLHLRGEVMQGRQHLRNRWAPAAASAYECDHGACHFHVLGSAVDDVGIWGKEREWWNHRDTQTCLDRR